MGRLQALVSRKRSAILIVLAGCLALAIAATIGASVLAANGGQPSKLNRLQQAAAAATARAQGPHAAKHPSTATQPASCPRPWGTGITAYRPDGGIHDLPMNNQAGVQTAGEYDYLVFAGSMTPGAKQGVLIVQPFYTDPCKEHAAAAPPSTVYPDPHQDGSLTITKVAGVIVSFSAADGASGSFNVVTGAYQ